MNNNSNGNLGKTIEKGTKGNQKQHIIDVFGQRTEATCNYYRCNHKFSEHGSGICRCKHPRNSILGILSVGSLRNSP